MQIEALGLTDVRHLLQDTLTSVLGGLAHDSSAAAVLHTLFSRQTPAVQVAVTLPTVEPRHTPEQTVPSLKLPCLLTALLQVCQPMFGPGRSMQGLGGGGGHAVLSSHVLLVLHAAVTFTAGVASAQLAVQRVSTGCGSGLSQAMNCTLSGSCVVTHGANGGGHGAMSLQVPSVLHIALTSMAGLAPAQLAVQSVPRSCGSRCLQVMACTLSGSCVVTQNAASGGSSGTAQLPFLHTAVTFLGGLSAVLAVHIMPLG